MRGKHRDGEEREKMFESKFSFPSSSNTRFSLLLFTLLLCSSLALIHAQIDADSLIKQTKSKPDSHYYERYDPIELIVEKLWSKSNPSETYSYIQLPFCEAKGSSDTSLGAGLTGSADSVFSKYDVRFQGLYSSV